MKRAPRSLFGIVAMFASAQSSSLPLTFKAPPQTPFATPSIDLGNGQAIEMSHGTTTLAFVFGGGIIAAVDSRASLGKLVGSRTTDKVLPVTRNILGTMAGGAADCSYWIRALSARMRLWELGEGSPATASLAAHVLVGMLRSNRGLSVGTMIMGCDSAGEPWQVYGFVDEMKTRMFAAT